MEVLAGLVVVDPTCTKFTQGLTFSRCEGVIFDMEINLVSLCSLWDKGFVWSIGARFVWKPQNFDYEFSNRYPRDSRLLLNGIHVCILNIGDHESDGIGKFAHLRSSILLSTSGAHHQWFGVCFHVFLKSIRRIVFFNSSYVLLTRNRR